jgi:hypothetical protein
MGLAASWRTGSARRDKSGHAHRYGLTAILGRLQSWSSAECAPDIVFFTIAVERRVSPYFCLSNRFAMR